MDGLASFDARSRNRAPNLSGATPAATTARRAKPCLRFVAARVQGQLKTSPKPPRNLQIRPPPRPATGQRAPSICSTALLWRDAAVAAVSFMALAWRARSASVDARDGIDAASGSDVCDGAHAVKPSTTALSTNDFPARNLFKGHFGGIGVLSGGCI